MWIAKFWLTDEKGTYETRARKFNVTLYGHTLSYYMKGNKAYLLGALLMKGREQNKKKFIKDLKKDPSVKELEIKGDFFTCLTCVKKTKSLERYEHIFYNPSVFLVKPVIVSASGEEWEVASFDRNALLKMIDYAEKHYKGKLLSFKKEKLSDIKIYTLFPKLTDKQKKALELAEKYGYYERPRKIELTKLAKIMGISFSTFQAHLRKAEKKILPFAIKRL